MFDSPVRAGAETDASPPAEGIGFRSVYQGILRGSGVYSVAVIVPRIASLLLLRLYTSYLTTSDYGIMELIELTVSLVGLLFGSNLASGFLYYYFQADSQEGRNFTLSSAIIGAALAGAVAASAGGLMAAPLSRLVFHTPAYAPCLRIAFTSFGLTLPVEIGYAYFRALNRAWTYVGANLAGLALSVTFNVLLLAVAGWGIRGILTSTLISTASLATLMAVFAFHDAGAAFRPRAFWRIFRYSVPVALGTGSQFLLHFSDRFILMRHIPTSQLGIYSLAYKFGMLISFMQQPYANYWTSQMYRLLPSEGGDVIYKRVFTYVVTVLTYAAVVITLAAGPALQVLVTAPYRGAVRLIPWLAAAYVIRAAGDHFRCIYYVQGRPGVDAKVLWAAGLTCVAASLLLIPRYGVWGAVASTIIGFATVAAVGFFTTRRMFAFRLEWRRVLLAVSLGVLLCAAARHIDTLPFVLRLAGAALAAGLYPLLLWAAGFFSPGEKAGISRALAAFLRRRGRSGNGTQG
jgi:O-antigen/teichoic acid export membrane protein